MEYSGFRNTLERLLARFTVKDGHIFIDVQASTHTDDQLYVFPEPVLQKISLLVGTFASLSIDKKPFAGQLLLSAGRLSDQKVRSVLGQEKSIEVTAQPEPPAAEHKT